VAAWFGGTDDPEFRSRLGGQVRALIERGVIFSALQYPGRRHGGGRHRILSASPIPPPRDPVVAAVARAGRPVTISELAGALGTAPRGPVTPCTSGSGTSSAAAG
jgi:hypothetical protein